MQMFHEIEQYSQHRREALIDEAATERLVALVPKRSPRERLALRLIGLALRLAPALRESGAIGRGVRRAVVS
jgi:hypothetical protein